MAEQFEEEFDDEFDDLFEDIEDEYTWFLAEGQEEFEVRNDVVVSLDDEDVDTLVDYIVSQGTRVITLADLEDEMPEIFRKLRYADPDSGDIRMLPPYALHEQSLLIAGDVLLQAFDRMASVPEVELWDRPSDYIRPLKDTEPDVCFYTRDREGWQEEDDMTIRLDASSFRTLYQYVIDHQSRMISLYDLRALAPEVYNSIQGVYDDWDPTIYSDKGLQSLHLGLPTEIVEAAFDQLHDLTIQY